MKPLGLNGLRLAAIIHPAAERPAFQELQWLVGGALDAYSLGAGARLAGIDGLYASMLAAARSSVARRRRRLAMISLGAPLHLSSMDNGYLGTLELEWASLDRSRNSRRRRLLQFCRNERMPVTLGSAMLYARDPRRERVRLNYFMPQTELEYSVRALRRFTTGA
jgi:DNA-binding transcriptional MocR family regulator